MNRFRIHPQLVQDCHLLGQMEACHVLLHRNAALPWWILVPETAQIDLLDLEPPLRDQVIGEAAAISRFLKHELGYPKVNVAAIGNLVPQLHVHVIGRRSDDACWPLPVWGHLQASSSYDAAQLSEIGSRLEAACGVTHPE